MSTSLIERPAADIARWWCIGLLPTNGGGRPQPWIRGGVLDPSLMATRNPFRRLRPDGRWSGPWPVDDLQTVAIGGPGLAVRITPTTLVMAVDHLWLATFVLLSGTIGVATDGRPPSKKQIRDAWAGLPPDVAPFIGYHQICAELDRRSSASTANGRE